MSGALAASSMSSLLYELLSKQERIWSSPTKSGQASWTASQASTAPTLWTSSPSCCTKTRRRGHQSTPSCSTSRSRCGSRRRSIKTNTCNGRKRKENTFSEKKKQLPKSKWQSRGASSWPMKKRYCWLSSRNWRMKPKSTKTQSQKPTEGSIQKRMIPRTTPKWQATIVLHLTGTLQQVVTTSTRFPTSPRSWRGMALSNAILGREIAIPNSINNHRNTLLSTPHI